MNRCSKCRLANGDHLASCPEVANTPRVQADRLEGRKYWGMLWIDESDNSTNFKFHVAGGDFASARAALTRFIGVIDDRIKNEKRCPFYGR